MAYAPEWNNVTRGYETAELQPYV